MSWKIFSTRSHCSLGSEVNDNGYNSLKDYYSYTEDSDADKCFYCTDNTSSSDPNISKI